MWTQKIKLFMRQRGGSSVVTILIFFTALEGMVQGFWKLASVLSQFLPHSLFCLLLSVPLSFLPFLIHSYFCPLKQLSLLSLFLLRVFYTVSHFPFSVSDTVFYCISNPCADTAPFPSLPFPIYIKYRAEKSSCSVSNARSTLDMHYFCSR